MTSKILKIKARQIFDSRGNPTVEVDLFIDKGMVRAMVPSGASTGIHEALELRDGEKNKYFGKGVSKAINNIKSVISPKIEGMDPINQNDIDQLMLELDGTENKSQLGANAILAVSMAVCKAGALAKDVSLFNHIATLANIQEFVLPTPAFNIINGGAHAGNKLDVQEYMILPTGAKNFHEALQMGTETYHHLKKILKDKFGKNASGSVGDEGGFAPNLSKVTEPIELAIEAIEAAGYTGKIMIGLDAAASEFYKDGKYIVEEKTLTGPELVEKYVEIAEKYPIISYEDPFAEDDFETHRLLTEKIGNKVQIVGDDLLVTNPKRIKKGIEMKAINALLLKVNQIGSLTEAIEACHLAQSAGWGVMVSHRSGETIDSFIADLVVGLKARQIKTGAPCRSERLAKYNQLLRIEEELGRENSSYAGVNLK